MDSNRMEDIVILYLFPNICTYISKYYCKIFCMLIVQYIYDHSW